jgi:poly-gamma-glutamate synthesis protein (capsule biosynthesis protein)
VGFGFRSIVSRESLVGALADFRSVVGPSDISFANLETPLSDVGLDRTARRSRQLRGVPAYAPVLRSAGFTILNVANNHSLEHGREAFLDSVSRIESLGIAVCGQRGVDGWSSRPAILTVNGMRIGAIGFTLRPAGDTTDRPHAEPTEEEILRDVACLRADVDCVIVSLHWGEEFVLVPSTKEVELAHAIVDAGASVILGHHPHVARPVERYRGAVIAYSLGNFAADMVWHDPLRRGLVLDCELVPGGVAQARVYQSRIDNSFLPRVSRADSPPLIQSTVAALPPDEYRREARDTVRAQRRALYRYTVRNAWRFDPRMLVDLAVRTARGKVAGLFGARDEIWG